jgi:thiamine kinase-like enzyme
MPAEISGAGFIFWVFHVIRDYARTLTEGNSRMVSRLPEFLRLADEMERAQVPMPIIYGHHDLLPANFLDDGRRLWLIDFEYAGFGTAMFDLAGIASNAGFDPDQARTLMIEYLGHPPSDDMVQSHAAMQCASLLREAMWSMVSELHLNAPGVDYEAYTQENLDVLAQAVGAYRTRFGKD